MTPSGLPGNGVLGFTGRTGCSGIQRDSNPAASACFASVATSMDVAVGKMNTPIFMDHLLAYPVVGRCVDRVRSIDRSWQQGQSVTKDAPLRLRFSMELVRIGE